MPHPALRLVSSAARKEGFKATVSDLWRLPCFKAGQFCIKERRLQGDCLRSLEIGPALRLVSSAARKEGFKATVSDLWRLPCFKTGQFCSKERRLQGDCLRSWRTLCSQSAVGLITLLEHRREGRTTPHLRRSPAVAAPWC
ncbi:hypothetical protein APTSU1_001836700 [Apodemus speciosus]|uniref:Uncharacterized protein n=1 Tax=Apodemus speciosus TaxID=105296 RepID=A0ABQ0FV75_APOSI